jgi:LysR family transcriptional regulator, transcriptional activator for dmlA
MKNLDLGAWNAFASVAKEGNFTRAARSLRISVPQLSKKIAKLEGDLGIRLFQRSTRQVSLTQEGQVLLPKVISSLDDFRNLEAEFENRDQINGVIRLTCLTGVAHRLLPPVLLEFMQLHPNVRIEADISDSLIDLIDSRVDLAIRVQEPEGGELIYKKLAPNDLMFCASPVFLKGLNKPIRKPEDLKGHPFYFLDAIADRKCGRTKFRLTDLRDGTPLHGNNGMFLTELALRHGGVAVRARWETHTFLKSGQLVEILKDYPIEQFGNIYAVVPSRRFLAARVRVFLDFLTERAKDWRY